ncbi:MAG TPA: SAM-dependent methyltransferase [Kineosporiaceae bacterium]|nr:SAM-dependent methyltransferase [Kineosporiaceae bacterium]
MDSQDQQAAPAQSRVSHVAPDGPELAFDTSVAHPARRYDYWLGGKDTFAADRESGDAIVSVFPTIRVTAVENRRFLGRADQPLVPRGLRRQRPDRARPRPSPADQRAILGPQFRFRTRDEVARFFDGHELTPPGITPVPDRRPADDGTPRADAADVSMWAGVARLHS